ncbi:MAG: diaminopimelate decarboxylase, partial [bacterium]|nr:diaminopimelate decarboxylase [bacterium]
MCDKRLPFAKDKLEEISGIHPTPFHIYDEKGIINTAENLTKAFSWDKGYKEFFPVKATPNPYILKLLKNRGFGADCSSMSELIIAERTGFKGEEIMFTSNDTASEEFIKAKDLGAIINLDDISHIPFLEKHAGIPELICFRYNPGTITHNDKIIGNPVESKFGFREDQLFEGYRICSEMGVVRFGIHTMVVSNELNQEFIINTAKILFELIVRISNEVGIRFEFVNLGGGIGIPYRPGDKPVDIAYVGSRIREHYENIIVKSGLPSLRIYMECGRYITGPHGYLVTRVRHIKKTYRNYAGLDSSMADLMRPGLYGAYHHISVPGKENSGSEIKYDVTGSL